MFKYKDYNWTLIDLLMALGVIGLCGYFAVDTIIKEGVSLASVAGSIWGFGTLIFVLIYPFPIFGSSIEGQKLLKEKEQLSHEEVEIVLGRRYSSKMNPKTLKLFILFFISSGVLTLVGIFTNT